MPLTVILYGFSLLKVSINLSINTPLSSEAQCQNTMVTGSSPNIAVFVSEASFAPLAKRREKEREKSIKTANSLFIISSNLTD